MKQSKLKLPMEILFILLVYRSLATNRQGIFYVSYWDKYIFGIACCVILFVALVARNQMKFTVPHTTIKVAIWLLIPISIAWLYSCVLFIIDPVEFDGIISRSFSNVAFAGLAVVQGMIVYLYFKKDAVNLIFFAYVASFMTSVIVAFLNGGVMQFAAMLFDSTYNGSVLEMSELTPAICLFMIYYLYKYKYRSMPRKEMIIRIGICLFILIVGMKRILILSSVIIIFLYWLINKKNGTLNRWVNIISVCLILVIYLYLYGIKSGLIYDIFEKYNINTMARVQLWEAVSGTYEFSPFYFGRGLGYSSKWMDNNWSITGIIGLSQTTGLHNDLLKYFIDLGFWGIGVYIYTYINIITKKIGSILDKKAELVYFLLMILQILCWFTDNVSGFHVFMWPFYMITFSLLSDVREEDKLWNRDIKIN